MGDVLFKTKGTFYRDTYYVHASFLVDVRRPYSSINVRLSYNPLFCAVSDERQREEMRQALAEQIFRTDEPFVSECVEKAYPIKNMISVAIRGPKKWLGEHHCFNGGLEEIRLGEKPTPGFFSAPNTAGQYEFVLHVFGIYTPECHYEFEVMGENDI